MCETIRKTSFYKPAEFETNATDYRNKQLQDLTSMYSEYNIKSKMMKLDESEYKTSRKTEAYENYDKKQDDKEREKAEKRRRKINYKRHGSTPEEIEAMEAAYQLSRIEEDEAKLNKAVDNDPIEMAVLAFMPEVVQIDKKKYSASYRDKKSNLSKSSFNVRVSYAKEKISTKGNSAVVGNMLNEALKFSISKDEFSPERIMERPAEVRKKLAQLEAIKRLFDPDGESLVGAQLDNKNKERIRFLMGISEAAHATYDAALKAIGINKSGKEFKHRKLKRTEGEDNNKAYLKAREGLATAIAEENAYYDRKAESMIHSSDNITAVDKLLDDNIEGMRATESKKIAAENMDSALEDDYKKNSRKLEVYENFGYKHLILIDRVIELQNGIEEIEIKYKKPLNSEDKRFNLLLAEARKIFDSAQDIFKEKEYVDNINTKNMSDLKLKRSILRKSAELADKQTMLMQSASALIAGIKKLLLPKKVTLKKEQLDILAKYPELFGEIIKNERSFIEKKAMMFVNKDVQNDFGEDLSKVKSFIDGLKLADHITDKTGKQRIGEVLDDIFTGKEAMVTEIALSETKFRKLLAETQVGPDSMFKSEAEKQEFEKQLNLVIALSHRYRLFNMNARIDYMDLDKADDVKDMFTDGEWAEITTSINPTTFKQKLILARELRLDLQKREMTKEQYEGKLNSYVKMREAKMYIESRINECNDMIQKYIDKREAQK